MLQLSPPYDAIAVANYFIKKSIEERNLLTPLKLIKLCYIAQGVYLYDKRLPLFKERCEAWKYGPVVPEIYNEFKMYGGEEIRAQGGYPEADAQGNLRYPVVVDEDTIKTLEFVWDNFKDRSGLQLSTWTHRKGSAWSKAIKGKKLLSYDNPMISLQMLRDEFNEVLERTGT